MTTKKKITKKKTINTIPKYKLKAIKTDYENGYPLTNIAFRHDVKLSQLETHMKKVNWHRKVAPVVREMTQEELDFWAKLIESTGELEQGYRILVFENLMFIRPEFVEFITAFIRKHTETLNSANKHFMSNRPDYMREALDAIKGVSAILERQFNMVSMTNKESGEPLGIPLHVTYNGKHESAEDEVLK